MSFKSRTSARTSTTPRTATSHLEVLERSGQGTLWISYRVRDKGRPGNPELLLKALQSAPNRHPRLPEALFLTLSRWHNIEHPAIAAPLEVGNEEGTFFFTAPLVTGPSLETRLTKGAFLPDQALRLLRAMVEPMAFLHGQGLAHGDLRPRQFLFDDFDSLVLTDGGVAEALRAVGLSQIDIQPESAYYLAPESGFHAPPSGSADMYALGAIFYRMLTGRVPFDGVSVVSVATKHRNEPAPAPSKLNPRVPPELDDLCARLLDKDPEARPRAAQLLEKRDSSRLVTPLRSPRAAPASTQTPTFRPTPEDAPPLPVAPLHPAIKTPNPAVVASSARSNVTPSTHDDAKSPHSPSLAKARKQHRRREFFGFAGALLWLLMLLGIGVGASFLTYNLWRDGIPQQVKVPPYIGLSQSRGREILASKGLVMRVARESYDPSKPEGTILVGDPEPGRLVRSRREVIVTISAGRAPVKMVDFSGLTLNRARTIILQHGLRLGSVVEQYHDTVPASFICGQFPEPGESLRRSDPMTLIVSRGPQPRDMDSTTESVPPVNSNLDSAQTPAENELNDTSTDLTPLEAAGTSDAPATKLETLSALIRVEVPSGRAQNVRILVRDSNGERTVFQAMKDGGAQVRERVTASRAAGEIAVVRVYMDDVLVKEEEL